MLPRFLAAAAALALVAGAALAAPIFLNAGGNELVNIGWRCDTGAYASPASFKYTSPRPIISTGGWKDVYSSHRWASSGNLEYKIPVPPGDHTVFLMFAETWSGASAGVRQFNVKINGALQSNAQFNGLLDVFAAAGGLDRPFFFNAGPVAASADGFITVTLERIPGKNNPFISGIVVNGPNSDALIGAEGAGSCTATGPGPMSVAPTPSASSSPGASVSASAQPGISSVPTIGAPTPNPPPSTVPGPVQRCTEAQTTTGRLGEGAFVMNVGGPALPAISWGADNINYIAEAFVGFTATAPVPVVVPSSWEPVYQTHRWTNGPTLTYRIPVPAGTYTVAMQHAESFLNGPGQRVFDIEINGVTVKPGFDVFAAVGKNKPLYSSFPGIIASNGAIEIVFRKVVENPFVNGIILLGPGASTIAIGGPEDLVCGATSGGTVTPAPSNAPTPGVTSTPTISPSANPTAGLMPPGPSVSPGCIGVVDTSFADTHFAHSVAGGPYVETDFAKNSFASVVLDGSNSHSHFQLGDVPGIIDTYRWTWTDPTNPLADSAGVVTISSKMTSQNFPLGVTTITLLVVDQFCNSASDTTTVTVVEATVPGAYCYYYDYGTQALTTVPLPEDISVPPKPMKGQSVGDINFVDTASFGSFPFNANSFAVRCVFSIDVPAPGPIQYKVLHNGPVRILHDGELLGSSNSTAVDQMTTTTSKVFTAGIQQWQILYFRPQALSGKLVLQNADGSIIPPSTVRHDSGATLPVISSMSKTSGAAEEILFIFGTAFVNGVKVRFGTEEAEQIDTTAGVIQVRAPEAPAGSVVDVTVTTQAGVSNGYQFTYTTPPQCPFPKFKRTTLTNSTGGNYVISLVAVVKYGPDRRLYVGTLNSQLHALTVSKSLQVTQQYNTSVFENWPRAVLGLAFDPTSSALKVYFAASTYSWLKRELISDVFTGWTNGKIQSVTMSSPTGDFNNDITDVVTGLPVANHDHSVQSMEFLPGGRMLVSIGGFTNGGISEPGDLLGGFWDPSLAGAIVECPTSGTAVMYNDTRPEFAQVTNPQGTTCSPYATGMRNSFGMTLHTNRNLYATDNGPNEGFGNFSTGCDGSFRVGETTRDKLFLVEEGKCHGYANLNRGRNGNPLECVNLNGACVQPLTGNLERSTNGVMEYTSNTFCDNARGNLFLSKYASGNAGKVNRIVLNSTTGTIADNGITINFFFESGVTIDEGPRGEIVMGSVYRGEDPFVVLQPDYTPPTTTFFISVMPKKGPATGGNQVLVTGHNFGTTPTAKFGDKDCTNIVVIDDESFTCNVPAGTVDEQVTVTVTGSTGISAGFGVDYWYF